MDILIQNISERDLAKLLGISKTYVRKLVDSDQTGDHLSDHLSDHNGLSKSLTVKVLNGVIVTTRVTTGVTKQVTTEERKVDKEIPMVSPTTPSLTKEINKERGSELLLFPPTSEIEVSNSEESDVSSTEEVNGERIDYDAFVEAFNSQIAGGHIPKIRGKLQGQRRAMLRARIKEYGKAAVWEACVNMKNSMFFKNSPKCSHFGWMIKPENFIKTLEGNYNR